MCMKSSVTKTVRR